MQSICVVLRGIQNHGVSVSPQSKSLEKPARERIRTSKALCFCAKRVLRAVKSSKLEKSGWTQRVRLAHSTVDMRNKKSRGGEGIPDR